MHYPTEKWFPIEDDEQLPEGILDDFLFDYFDPNGELTPNLLIDLQSGNYDRGIVALPYTRQSDNQTVYIPQSIIGNLFVSNGMSAGNTKNEARVQGLSEVFERFVKNRIITEAISLPEIPQSVIDGYPTIKASIENSSKKASRFYAMTHH
ncbi:YcaO-like family [Actinobacillus equuli]|nr:YcaO-like family [Actinobacillus equuli]